MLRPNMSTQRSASPQRLVTSTGVSTPARYTWQPCDGQHGSDSRLPGGQRHTLHPAEDVTRIRTQL